MRTKLYLEIEIEDGKVVSVKKVEPIGVIDKSASIYARYFDEGSAHWQTITECNLLFLESTQVYMNDLLKTRGYVFLNEVYDALGIPRTKEGQVVGWIYNEKHHIGDNYIDFGIYESVNQDFVNGRKNIALLDFNVDGNILEVLREEGEA